MLGSLEAYVRGEPLDLGWPKQRALLAALLLTPNRAVAIADLVDAVWGEDPPASAVNGLHKYVSTLRGLIGPDRLITRQPGYLVSVETDELDLLQFEALAAEQRWPEALALWRGEPCEDVELGDSWRARLQALRESREAVRGHLIDSRLAAGEYEPVIPELRALVAAEPLCEQHWVRLMRALHHSGRTAEALAAFAQARAVLADELGIEPGAELRSLHAALLVSGDELTVEQAVRGAWAPQCQLPMDMADFVGRICELAQVERSLMAEGVAVAVVTGPPGVGKTALAVRVAHRLRTRFPDGQWFVPLNGAGNAPREPVAVLADLLRSSGVEGTAVPDGVDARAAAFRARLADRRVLLVLDDAADAEQVRPLLPGCPGSAVLVTSRSNLLGLAAIDGARIWPLDVLPRADSIALLRRTLLPAQAATEPKAVAEVAELCGHLPLALRIAAANIAGRSSRSVSRYVADLRANPLARLAVHGDDSATVRAAFGLSYMALLDDAARLFRLLGLIPGHDFTAQAAAVLMGASPELAESLLGRLAGASLVQEKAPGRFHLHDLLRCYAAERSYAEDRSPVRAAALDRLFSWYLRMVDTAADLLYPQMARLQRSGRERAAFRDAASARDWLDSERANICAACTYAAENGPHCMSWHLADALRGYFWYGLHCADWAGAAQAGLDAAMRAADRSAEAAMRASLGVMNWCRDDHLSAVEHYERALAIQLADGLDADAASTLNNLSQAYQSLGRLKEAEGCLLRGQAISARLGDDTRRGIQMSNYGVLLMYTGRLDEALDCLRRAADTNDRLTAAICHGNSTEVCLELGRNDEAWRHIERAIELYGELGKHPATNALDSLAKVYLAIGQAEQALATAHEVLGTVEETGSRSHQVAALNTLGAVLRCVGRQAEAVDRHAQALGVARRFQYRRAEIVASIGLADCERDLGRPAGALEYNQHALALAERAGFVLLEAQALAGLARSNVEAGRFDEAAAYASRALEVYAQTGQRHLYAAVRRLQEELPPSHLLNRSDR